VGEWIHSHTDFLNSTADVSEQPASGNDCFTSAQRAPEPFEYEDGGSHRVSVWAIASAWNRTTLLFFMDMDHYPSHYIY